MRRDRLADQRGMTLIELLVAMSVGTVVLLAAFMLIDRSFSASGQIADRTDALQRGRQAMLLMSRQLRSQVCVGTVTNPMVAAEDNTVTFYSDLTDNLQVKRRTLTFNPATDTITQSVIDGVGTYPALTFTGTPTPTTLLTKVKQVMDGTTARPMFRYLGYVPGNPPGDLETLGAPWTTEKLGRVAVIRIAFRAFADRPISDDGDSTVLENEVYVRVSVDPTQTVEGPRCI